MILPHSVPVISSHLGRQVVVHGRRRVSPPVVGPRRLLARQHMESLPPPAPRRDWIAAAAAQCGGDFGQLLNNELGCCTIADGPGHCTQVWTANAGPAMITPPDSAILRAYEAVDGYIPGRPDTDNGGVETEVLGAWQRGIEGFARLDGWIPVNPANIDHVRKAIERYGALYIGVALPLSAQNEEVWTVLGGSGSDEANSWGGHAISLHAYDEVSFDCITWGRRQKMSIDWFLTYCDEAYAPLCGTLWCPNGRSPAGDSVTDLQADLQAVT
ncbi:MAG TPA: hypothetical protein VN962_04295 [Polyangia bacterium]|nr:hypothetical protein [Polyangia bacterium]